MKGFYEAHFRPDQVVASVVGDISKNDLTVALKRAFGAWVRPARPKSDASLAPFPKIVEKKLVLVDKPDAGQAYFIMGSPGLAMGDPITPAAAVSPPG